MVSSETQYDKKSKGSVDRDGRIRCAWLIASLCLCLSAALCTRPHAGKRAVYMDGLVHTAQGIAPTRYNKNGRPATFDTRRQKGPCKKVLQANETANLLGIVRLRVRFLDSFHVLQRHDLIKPFAPHNNVAQAQTLRRTHVRIHGQAINLPNRASDPHQQCARVPSNCRKCNTTLFCPDESDLSHLDCD